MRIAFPSGIAKRMHWEEKSRLWVTGEQAIHDNPVRILRCG